MDDGDWNWIAGRWNGSGRLRRYSATFANNPHRNKLGDDNGCHIRDQRNITQCHLGVHRHPIVEAYLVGPTVSRGVGEQRVIRYGYRRTPISGAFNKVVSGILRRQEVQVEECKR